MTIKAEGKKAARDIEMIEEFRTTIKKLKTEIKNANKHHLDVKRKLYDDMNKEKKKVEKKLTKFRNIAETEITLKDEVIKALKDRFDKINVELGVLKGAFEFPRLREQLRNYDFKGNNYNQILAKL